MSDNKKYYYLKVKDNFYESEEIIILQNMNDGYLYSDILMKLYLRSLKNGGKLMFKDVIPYNPQMLATVVRHHVGVVEKALGIFVQLGLIEVLDNGAIYMSDIQNFIGESSSEADRVRKYRKKIDEEKQSAKVSESKERFVQMYDKCTPEIEIEKDIELKINTIDQNEIADDKFELFWNIYPKKVAKKKAYTTFKNIKFKKGQFEKFLNKVQKDCEAFKSREYQYIPNPQTYLNREDWNDEETYKVAIQSKVVKQPHSKYQEPIPQWYGTNDLNEKEVDEDKLNEIMARVKQP